MQFFVPSSFSNKSLLFVCLFVSIHFTRSINLLQFLTCLCLQCRHCMEYLVFYLSSLSSPVNILYTLIRTNFRGHDDNVLYSNSWNLYILSMCKCEMNDFSLQLVNICCICPLSDCNPLIYFKYS